MAPGFCTWPDGTLAYVVAELASTVSAIETADNRVIGTIAVGKRPWNMAITPDGKKLYVANDRANSVSVIDTESNRAVKEIAVGELPWGVVIR